MAALVDNTLKLEELSDHCSTSKRFKSPKDSESCVELPIHEQPTSVISEKGNSEQVSNGLTTDNVVKGAKVKN